MTKSLLSNTNLSDANLEKAGFHQGTTFGTMEIASLWFACPLTAELSDVCIDFPLTGRRREADCV